MSEVFAFEWCSCIYESAFGIMSLHTTKRGAFKAMVAEANRKWQEDRNSQLMSGGSRPRHSPLLFEAWRVIRIKVSNDKCATQAKAQQTIDNLKQHELTLHKHLRQCHKTWKEAQQTIAEKEAKIAELKTTIADFNRRCEAGYNKLNYLDAIEKVAELEARIKDSQKIRDAAYNYMGAVRALFMIGADGTCLVEKRPSQDAQCYDALMKLNDTGKTLDALVVAVAPIIQEEK